MTFKLNGSHTTALTTGPDSGRSIIYIDTVTKKLASIDSDDNVTDYAAAGGGGLDEWVSATAYTTEVIWLAADDKIYRCTTPNSDVTFTVGNWTELSADTTSLSANTYSENLTSGNWVLDSGTIYYQDVTHSLGSNDLFKSFVDSADGTEILIESAVSTDTNTLRVKVEGNSLNIRVNITSGIAGNIVANTAVFTTLSTNTTLNTTTHKYLKIDTSSGDITLTLPLSANGLYSYDIWKTTTDTNKIIVTRAGSDTIIGETTFEWSKQYSHYEFMPDTSTTWFVK